MLSLKNHWLSVSIIYLSIFIGVSIISFLFFNQFKLFYTDVDSARYVLSSLVQSEATILAIVVTLSLVAVQLASASSSKIIDIFKRTPDLWILIIIYIFAIAYCITLLKLILNTQSRISNLESYILFAYYISMFAFVALIPYIWNILDLMKPATVIDRLAERITSEKILKALEVKNIIERDDPLQPIIDIMNASLMKYDYGTFREGLKAFQNATNDILDDEISIDERKKIINHITYHLTIIKGQPLNSETKYLVDDVMKNIILKT